MKFAIATIAILACCGVECGCGKGSSVDKATPIIATRSNATPTTASNDSQARRLARDAHGRLIDNSGSDAAPPALAPAADMAYAQCGHVAASIVTSSSGGTVTPGPNSGAMCFVAFNPPKNPSPVCTVIGAPSCLLQTGASQSALCVKSTPSASAASLVVIDHDHRAFTYSCTPPQ